MKDFCKFILVCFLHYCSNASPRPCLVSLCVLCNHHACGWCSVYSIWMQPVCVVVLHCEHARTLKGQKTDRQKTPVDATCAPVGGPLLLLSSSFFSSFFLSSFSHHLNLLSIMRMGRNVFHVHPFSISSKREREREREREENIGKEEQKEGLV